MIPQALALQDTPEPCGGPDKPCPEEASKRSDVVVTGSMITSPPASITNNQMAGVDEGDIVKQIGDYLLVLQDGRIFATNIKSMKLTDRFDVYRRNADGRPIGASWYDEMVVQGDSILVTAYSNKESATELSIFRLDQASGKLSRRGVFLISSDDYYSVRNYASRIVGDRLVLYSSFGLDALADRRKRPVIRRWLRETERKSRQAKGVPIIDARRVYWPVMPTIDPAIHTVTSCALGKIETRDLDCRTTGFVAPRRREMMVSPNAVYIWTLAAWEGNSWDLPPCVKPGQAMARAPVRDVPPGVVYRIPASGGEPSILPVRGGLVDQFSLDENSGRFRALAAWITDRCEYPDEGYVARVGLLDVPIRAFSNSYRESDGNEILPLPDTGKPYYENRFADNWLVYGGRSNWETHPPDDDRDVARSAKAIAVPLDRPKQAQELQLNHEFVRIDRIGKDMMLSGYRDDKGLSVSTIKLGRAAQAAGSILLANRYESEGRSHAFNSTVNENGGGLMAFPTVESDEDAYRWWWRSDASDISFLSFAPDGALVDLGAIRGTPKAKDLPDTSYDCEVSCIDWYGNSRPIFTGNRIFALMGTGLVEVELAGGKVREKQRIDLTGPIRLN